MAKIKSYEYKVPFSLTTLSFPNSYWKIGELHIDTVRQVVNVMVFGYADKASRDAGIDPVDRRTWTLRGDFYTQWFSPAALDGCGYNVIKQAYEMLDNVPLPGDTQSFFSGATDDWTNNG